MPPTAFGHLTNGHVQKAQQSASEGTASMQAAVAGFEGALATIGERIDAAIATSLEELDRDFRGKLAARRQIAPEAWKAAEKEQPAWKSVVAIVLVILVIIAAAVISIVTLGAGASLFAIILVGALVGAVSAGLIQIINNWASGEAWHAGLAQAMIMGAIGGAIGGGLGFAGGALTAGAAAAGARVATQFAIHVGADLLSEGITQTIGYVAFGQEFNWQGFVMAGAMSGVSFRAHPSVPRRGAAGRARLAPRPAPRRRRAAVTQVAGGAAVGLGVEAATAITARSSTRRGQPRRRHRARSAPARRVLAVRTWRRRARAKPPAPRSPAGQAPIGSARSILGGVGGRAQTALEGLGGRAFGPRPAADVPGTRPPAEGPGTPRVEEPEAATVRPPAEAEAGPARAPEEAEPLMRARPDEETDTGRPRTGEAEEGIPTRRPDQDAEGETPPSEHPSRFAYGAARAKCPCESAKRIITSASAVDRKGLKCGSGPAHAVRSRCGSTICFPTSLRALAHEIS